MKKKINIGIIGLGRWGKNYLRIFNEIKNVNIEILCDRNIKINSEKKFTKDSSLVTKSKEIDAVIIATEAKSHFKLASEALKNNKHVLVEKPLTDDYSTSLNLSALANKKKKILMVGHTFLYNPAIQKMKSILSKNTIGKIYYINCRRTHIGPIRKDVNVVWDLATHDVSIINYLLEETPKKVFSVGAKHISKNTDVSYINLIYKNKILGNIHVSWEDSNKTRTVEIIGSKARILFDDLNLLEPIKIFNKGIGIKDKNINFGESKFMQRDGSILSPKIETKEPLKQMCINFIECILRNRQPLSNGKFSSDIIRTLDKINKNIFLA